MQKKKFDVFRGLGDYSSRIYILIGIIFLAAHIAICAYTSIQPQWSGLVAIILYIAVCVLLIYINGKRMSIYRSETEASDSQSGSVIAAFRDSVNIPYAIVDESGKIITVNAAMRNALPRRDTFLNTNIADLCSVSFDKLIKVSKKNDEEQQEALVQSSDTVVKKPNMIKLGSHRYTVTHYPIKFKGHIYYMIIFEDISEYCELADRHFAQTPVVAYIMLDNLEEIAQYVKVSYRSEANQVDTILKEWAASIGGVLREYDRDKYILILSRKALASCERNKFEILDTIRQIKIGDENMPITVSMGIATTGDSLAARERDALVALDTALQRGGDQVVIKKSTGLLYFGGSTKSQQKRTKGHARIIANKLCSMIQNASNVIIMGHANPDFDSIGACIGVASLAKHLGVDAKIVVDTKSRNFLNCTNALTDTESEDYDDELDYNNVFVDEVVGLGYCSFGTLLIIVDANNFKILESPDIAAKSFKSVVIDHHIKKEEFEHEPELTYIDPSASSASELITEILEQALPAGTLSKDEANVLMSGIMVDTNNFTRTVGTRTFAAALYLRNAGASTEVARTFFEEEFDSYRAEAMFGAGVETFRDRMAITVSEGTGSPHDRTAAAKSANKLLTVRNIDAAFALVRIGNTIHISARSNGSINVQLIVEKIGGGGHFDMAGAALADKSLDEAVNMLKTAIDEHLDKDLARVKNKD